MTQLESKILGLLVDAPSSVAGLWATLVLFCDYPQSTKLGELISVLRTIDRRGWIYFEYDLPDRRRVTPTEDDINKIVKGYEEWLGAILGFTLSDLAWDRVGLWCTITDLGRAALDKSGKLTTGDASHLWMIEHYPPRRVVVIRAPDESIAEQVVTQEVLGRLNLGIVDKTLRKNITYALRNGQVVESGVELTCTY